MTSAVERSPVSSRPCRVLHVHAGNLYGGVETFLLTLADRDSSTGLQSVFGLCFEGRLSNELRDAGAIVAPLSRARFSRPWTIRQARKNLEKLLSRESFGAIVTHNTWTHALFAPVATALRLPVVYWAHNPPDDGFIERLASRTPPALVIANSEFTLSCHGSLFLRAPRAVVRYPVRPPAIGPKEEVRLAVREEFETPMHHVVIVCSSRFERWKGHHLLLDALTRLADLPGWTAWIAGGAQRPSEAPYLGELNARCAQGALRDRVRFVGQRDDIYRVLCAADVHCQPNIGPEPFGIAFVEALHSGLPVVTTAIGGAREIVTSGCGRLVVPEADAVAAALRELTLDADLRKELGQSAPARAAELCDPRATIRIIEQTLAGVVQSAAAKPSTVQGQAAAHLTR